MGRRRHHAAQGREHNTPGTHCGFNVEKLQANMITEGIRMIQQQMQPFLMLSSSPPRPMIAGRRSGYAKPSSTSEGNHTAAGNAGDDTPRYDPSQAPSTLDLRKQACTRSTALLLLTRRLGARRCWWKKMRQCLS